MTKDRAMTDPTPIGTTLGEFFFDLAATERHRRAALDAPCRLELRSGQGPFLIYPGLDPVPLSPGRETHADAFNLVRYLLHNPGGTRKDIRCDVGRGPGVALVMAYLAGKGVLVNDGGRYSIAGAETTHCAA